MITSTEQQQGTIAIAEVCGLLNRPSSQIVEYRRWDAQADGVFERVKFLNKDGSIRCVSPTYIENLPHYFHDLNAIRNALMIQDRAFRYRFESMMDNYCAGADRLWCELTAEEYAKIFLQVCHRSVTENTNSEITQKKGP